MLCEFPGSPPAAGDPVAADGGGRAGNVPAVAPCATRRRCAAAGAAAEAAAKAAAAVAVASAVAAEGATAAAGTTASPRGGGVRRPRRLGVWWVAHGGGCTQGPWPGSQRRRAVGQCVAMRSTARHVGRRW